MPNHPEEARTARLTPMEIRVVELLSEDLSDEAIAERLRISRRTVEDHLANARAKTGARTRVGLVVLALREGLVPLTPRPSPEEDG